MSNMPVLVVDDEPSVLDGLNEFLEDEGYCVYLADNGSQALDIFREVRPELMPVDLKMHGMTGIELIRRVKQMEPHIVIIVITAYGSLDSAVESFRLNVYDFILKPFELDYLRDSLEQARRRVQVNRQLRMEIGSLRSRLELAQDYLQQYERRMSEVRSLAVAARILAGVVAGCIDNFSNQDLVAGTMESESIDFDRLKAEAFNLDRSITSILEKFRAD